MLETFIRVDTEGELWFEKPGSEPVLISALDNLCGIGFFETGADDPFIRCCGYHDQLYKNRRFFEERGWNRLSMDEFFLKLMLEVAGIDPYLQKRANQYYGLVRAVGHLVYYRHEPKEGGIRHRKHPNSNIRRP